MEKQLKNKRRMRVKLIFNPISGANDKSPVPYIGTHYQVGSENSFQDGLLDVLFSADLSKLDLIGCVIKGASSTQDDPRIQHFRVKKIVIDTSPPMPIMADGVTIGAGSVQIEVLKHALNVMVQPIVK